MERVDRARDFEDARLDFDPSPGGAAVTELRLGREWASLVEREEAVLTLSEMGNATIGFHQPTLKMGCVTFGRSGPSPSAKSGRNLSLYDKIVPDVGWGGRGG